MLSSLKEWFSGTPSITRSPTTFMMLIIRVTFVALAIGIGTSAMTFVGGDTGTDDSVWRTVISLVAFIAVALLIIFIDVKSRNKQVATISAVFFGLLLGFFLAELFWRALAPIVEVYARSVALEAQAKKVENLIHLFITVVACYITVALLVQTKDDFRFIIPYVEFSKQLKGPKPMVLDTSVIIDGRIADICETGIIDSKLIVPRFVLQELQAVADSSDKIKRNRGRRGLDILKKMQGNPKIDLQIHEANLTELREVNKVDERLVVLAKVVSGRVVTNDFNLNKICQLQGVEVLNLNELANAMKVVALPGETLPIKVVKQGDQIGQGIGYLDDGTMVVVEQGRNSIGQDVIIAVTSVLQTPAGRMIFGRIERPPSS